MQLAGKKNALALGLVGVLLLAAGGAAIGLPGPIRAAQVSNLQGQNQYQTAVNLLVADKASNEDIAAAYDAWGEHLTSAGQYAQAITEFDVVLNSYTSATNGVARANKGEATAYYDKAEGELHAGDYKSAVQDFQTLTSRFPNSPEKTTAHEDYAKALLGLGNQELKQGGQSGCTSADHTYNQLATNFSDTPEGQQAKTKLAATVDVGGTFTGTVKAAPSGEVDAAFLIPNADLNFSGNEVIEGGEVHSNGQFVVTKVKPGTYGLVWGYFNPNANGGQGQLTLVGCLGGANCTTLTPFPVLPLCDLVIPIPGPFSNASFSSHIVFNQQTIRAVYIADSRMPMALVREILAIFKH